MIYLFIYYITFQLKLRNETDNINFVKSLNGRMTSTAQSSVNKQSRPAHSGIYLTGY